VRGHRGTLLLVAIATAGALVPLPPAWIERVYSRGIYARVQPALTSASNLVPVALLDVLLAAVLIGIVWSFSARVRNGGVKIAARLTLLDLIRIAAIAYVLFLALWGLNYRRVPLEERLDYDRSRLTRDAVLAFANRAVDAVNGGYTAAHQMPVDLDELSRAFGEAERGLGAVRPTVVGVPKRSLLTFYFRRAAVDGMTDPLFLEIIVNPDVLDAERPMVVAHEWGHLAGYANESEASFIAWLACVRAGALPRYSAWLAAYGHSVRALRRPDRAAVKPLAAGPRGDLLAMAARYSTSSPVVRRAAEGVYDEYLRANRVSEGIASYDAVLRLMVGTRFEADFKPVVR
jgi:hypothetical protein